MHIHIHIHMLPTVQRGVCTCQVVAVLQGRTVSASALLAPVVVHLARFACACRLNLEAVTQDGDKLRLRCRRTTLVGDIWRHVAKKIGRSSDQFCVRYDGEPIQYYAAIGLYGVKDGDRLDVVVHHVAC